MRKKILSVLLSVCMVLTLMPAVAFAESGAAVEQPAGLDGYKVIAAGVAKELPAGFSADTHAGIAASETNTERLYVQLNKPVPAGYTITLTVYPANEAKGAYLAAYITGGNDITPERLCYTTERMAQWYWGNDAVSSMSDKSLNGAFNNPEKLYFHVGIAKVGEDGAPLDVATATDENGKVTFDPKNSVTKTEGSETGDTPALIEIDPDNPYETPSEEAVTLTVEPAAENSVAELGGMKVSKLQKEIVATPDSENDKLIKVTGTSYKTNWDAFSSVTDQKNGNYVALKLTATGGIAIKITSPTEDNAEKTLDADGILVLNLKNLPENKQSKVKVTPTAGGEDVEFTLDFREVEQKSTSAPLPELPAATLKYTAKADTSVVSDCQDDTMWVEFASALSDGTHLWFEITGDGKTYGIAADTSNATTTKFAWSFLNKSQFEKWAKNSDNEDVALGSTPGAEYTVKGYQLDASAAGNTSFTLPTNSEAFATWMVTVPNVIVEAPGDPIVDDSNLQIPGLTGEELEAAKTAAKEAAGSVEVAPSSTSVITAAANEKATESAEIKTEASAQIVTEKIAELELESSITNAKIVYQPALTVKAKEYNPATKTLEVDITAYLNAVVTNNDVSVEDIKIKTSAEDTTAGTNAAVVKSEKLTVAEPITLSVTLPDDFFTPAAGATTTIYVEHSKGQKHLHQVSVNNSDRKATFTSSDGLSPFVFKANMKPAAKIGDTYYETLQDAVDSIATDGTITVLDNTATATVNEAKTITLVAGPGVTIVEGMLTAGSNVDKAFDDGTGTFIFTVKSTSGDSGSSGSTGGGGGGSSVTTYTVTVPSSVDNGKITVSPRNASKGNIVTITATPDEGYKVGTITVKDKDGNEIEVKDAGDNKYTFVMPASKVDITATFVEDDGKEPTDPTDPTDPTQPTTAYSDVAATAWYYDAVVYVTNNGLMNGVGNGMFAPNSNLSRAMLAQILYNKAGKPAAGASAFTDVAAGQWYTDAVAWAAAQGVVNGLGNNMFGPNNNITREQLAVMLYRYEGSPAVSGGVTGFNDAGQISSYATSAMAWATTNGVMNGKGDGRLDPKGLATRAEVAQMMQNYFK